MAISSEGIISAVARKPEMKKALGLNRPQTQDRDCLWSMVKAKFWYCKESFSVIAYATQILWLNEILLLVQLQAFRDSHLFIYILQRGWVNSIYFLLFIKVKLVSL